MMLFTAWTFRAKVANWNCNKPLKLLEGSWASFDDGLLIVGFGAGTNFCIPKKQTKDKAKQYLYNVAGLSEKQLIKFCNKDKDWCWWSDRTGKPDLKRKWIIRHTYLDGITEIWK